MAPNFCPSCGAKLAPEQKFCQDCGVLLTPKSSNIVTSDSVQRSTTPSSTARPRAHSEALELGIIGGALGGFIGVLVLWAFVGATQQYYADPSSYSADAGSLILLGLLEGLGVLGFSIVGALGAAQKLDARSRGNAGGLFLAGVGVLICMLLITIPRATGGTFNFSYSLGFTFLGIIISVLFFLSASLLLPEAAR